MTKLHHRTPLLTLAIAAALSALPRAAVAEDPQWVPVIVDQASSEQTLTLVNAIATVLRTKENVALLDPAVAAQKFETVHSAAPVEVPEDELRELGDSFRRALEAAAIGQWDKAYEIVRRFDELSQPVQDYVTWRLNLSRDIFDYCLMSVHFMLAAGREGAARDEMRSCIYSAPQRTLSPKEIPEHVIQIHEAVKAELLAQGQASLDVDVSGAPASATGCIAVVNGAPKGALPYRETGLLPVPVRIQVNCQRTGRIHVVGLKPGRNSLIVDLRFERVVSTEDFLGLRYADAREEQASQVRDALTLAKTLGGADLLLVRRLADGRLSVRRYGTQLEQLVSEVTLAMKANADEIRVAAHALATSRSGAIAASDESSTDSTAANGDRGSDAFAGIMVAVGSVSSFAIAWGTYAEGMRFRGKVAEEGGCAATAQQGADVLCIQSFARYQTLGDVTLVVGALGSALGIAASPAALPDAEGIPLWSWVAGAAGVGVVTAGALLWSDGTSCSLDACEDGTDPKLGQLGRVRVHEITQPKVGRGRVLRDDRISVQREIRLRRREHRACLFRRPVEHVAAGGRDRRMANAIQVRGRNHLLPQLSGRTRRIGKHAIHLGQRRRRAAVLGPVEHMQHDADEQRLCGLLPVRLEPLAVGIDDQRREILDVGDLVLAAEPDLVERVPAHGACDRGGLEPEHAVPRPSAAPSRREAPELPFEVRDERAVRPGQKRGHDEPDAFACTSRRVAQDVLGTRVP